MLFHWILCNKSIKTKETFPKTPYYFPTKMPNESVIKAELLLEPGFANIFQCKKCKNIPINAYICPANHIFCYTCINDLITNNQECPELKCNELILNVVESEHITKLIQELKVRCPYSNCVNKMDTEGMVQITKGNNNNNNNGSDDVKLNDSEYCNWEGSIHELVNNHLKTCKYKKQESPLKLIGCNAAFNNNSLYHFEYIAKYIYELKQKMDAQSMEINALKNRVSLQENIIKRLKDNRAVCALFIYIIKQMVS